jgi:hypothetical protein
MPEALEVRPITESEVAVLDAAYPEHESRHQVRLRQQLAGEGTYFAAWAARSCPICKSPLPTAAPALAVPCSTSPSG